MYLCAFPSDDLLNTDCSSEVTTDTPSSSPDYQCLKSMQMWCLETWDSGGPGSVWLVVGLNGLLFFPTLMIL